MVNTSVECQNGIVWKHPLKISDNAFRPYGGRMQFEIRRSESVPFTSPLLDLRTPFLKPWRICNATLISLSQYLPQEAARIS